MLKNAFVLGVIVSTALVFPGCTERGGRQKIKLDSAAIRETKATTGLATTLQIQPEERHSIGVFYFENVTGDEDLNWMCRGLTEMLITDLSQSRYVDVFGEHELIAIMERMGITEQQAMDATMAISVGREAELETVFAEIPQNDDRFNLVLSPSRPARLWIDLFTYVAIDDSSGAYLFIRNSENGRRTLFSANNVAEMADRITNYMAQEIVRRERMEQALLETAPRQKAVIEAEGSGPGTGIVLAAFIIGVITGAAGLFAAVWLSVQ